MYVNLRPNRSVGRLLRPAGVPSALNGLTASIAAAWSPTQWFSAGEQGLWYDPTDLTRYMSTAGMPELVTNGTFDAGTANWAVLSGGSTISVVDGALKVSGQTSSPTSVGQTITTVVGKRYLVVGRYRYGSSPGAAVRLLLGTVDSPNNTSLEFMTGSAVFTATSTSTNVALLCYGTSATEAYFDDISVKELPLISTATMYQDSFGTTPVTAVEQPVGLILDRRLGALGSLGAELVTNGTFDSDTTGWTASNSTISAPSGRLRVTETGAAAAGYARQSFAVVSGSWYRVTVDITTMAASKAQVWVGSSYGGAQWLLVDNITTARTLTAYFRATTTTAFFELVMSCSLGGTSEYVEFDNVSVRHVPGNHASQATSTARPTLRNRHNQLAQSQMRYSGVSPSGFTVAGETLTVTNSLALATLVINPQPAACEMRAVFQARAGTTKWLRGFFANFTGATAPTCDIDLQAMTIVGAPAGASVSDAGDGWRNITIPATLVAGDLSGGLTLRVLSNSGSATAVVGETIEVRNIDVRTVADLQGTYYFQDIRSATDYDSDPTKFPYYLAFDGSDDSLATGSIDFTATDKMTVVAGVTNLTAASLGILFELTATANTNAGAFNAYVNDAATGGVVARNNKTGTSNTGPAEVAVGAPNKQVYSFDYDFARTTGGQAIYIRRNGVAYSNGGTNLAGPEKFANAPLYIGRRGGSSLPFNGRLHQLIIRGAASADIAQAESFAATKTGVTL